MAQVPASDADWKRVPAIYTDVFDIAVIPDIKMVRMAFSEATAGIKPGYLVRTAIMMPMSDAMELVRVLGNLIRETEEQAAKPSNSAA